MKNRKFENENNDNKKLKNFRKIITDTSFELPIDDRLTVDHAGRFKRTESFLKKVFRKDDEKCDRLLRTIKGLSLVKRNTERNLGVKKNIQEDFLLLRDNILKKALLDNINNQQSLILQKEDIRTNLEDIQKKSIQKKANRNCQSPVKNIQENPRLLQKDTEDSSLLVKQSI